MIKEKVALSSGDLERAKVEYRQIQNAFDDCIMQEKDHFKRIKDFEAACDMNEQLRGKLGMWDLNLL